MSNSNTTVRTGGVGLGGVIFAIFLALKLAEVGTVAHWSWWWVISPLWIPLGLVLAIIVGVFVVAFAGNCIRGIVDGLTQRRRLARMMGEDVAGRR